MPKIVRVQRGPCRVEISEIGYDSPIQPAAGWGSISGALEEAKALSRHSDGAVQVQLRCNVDRKFPRKKKGTAVYRGAVKSSTTATLFTCEKGVCTFARGNWAERLGQRGTDESHYDPYEHLD